MQPEPMIFTGTPTVLFQVSNTLGLEGFKVVTVAMTGPPSPDGQITCQFMVIKNPDSNPPDDFIMY